MAADGHGRAQCKGIGPLPGDRAAGGQWLFSYLQDYLPHVAQAVVREGWVDFVGLGRMVLAYPNCRPTRWPAGRWIAKEVCRTFSDCTTAPRNGLISGCYPLDPEYKRLPEREQLIEIKQRWQKD